MAETPKPAEPKAAAKPLVMAGDHVYFDRKAPRSGKVVSHGEHGAVVEHGGKRHSVPWDEVLGHKSRAASDVRIVDEGEDGFIVRGPDGKRRFVHDPVGADMPALAKSRLPVVLLTGGREAFAKTIKNGAGLALRDVTDKVGHHTKRWKRSAPEERKGREAGKAETPGSSPYKAGDKVTFEAGAFKGEGTVYSAGRKGGWIKDSTGRAHKVDWHEVKGAAVAADPAEPQAASDPKPGSADGAKDAPAPKSAGGGAGGAGGAGGGGDGPVFPESETAKLPRAAAQPFDTWADLEKHGKEGLEQFQGALDKVAEKLGLRSDLTPDDLSGEHVDSPEGFLFMGPLKKKARAEPKVMNEYDGDWSKLRDYMRATISVSSVDEFRAAVAAVKDAGLALAQKPKDRFSNPTHEGYRDLMTVVRLPNGMVAELQYHLKAMTAAKAEAHDHYAANALLQRKYGEDAPGDRWSDEDQAAFHKGVKAQKDVYEPAWKRATAGPKKPLDKPAEPADAKS